MGWINQNISKWALKVVSWQLFQNSGVWKKSKATVIADLLSLNSWLLIPLITAAKEVLDYICLFVSRIIENQLNRFQQSLGGRLENGPSRNLLNGVEFISRMEHPQDFFF